MLLGLLGNDLFAPRHQERSPRETGYERVLGSRIHGRLLEESTVPVSRKKAFLNKKNRQDYIFVWHVVHLAGYKIKCLGSAKQIIRS